MNKQLIINKKIEESFIKLKESKDLIKKAIKAVEVAIEKSEGEAIKLLK